MREGAATDWTVKTVLPIHYGHLLCFPGQRECSLWLFYLEKLTTDFARAALQTLFQEHEKQTCNHCYSEPLFLMCTQGLQPKGLSGNELWSFGLSPLSDVEAGWEGSMQDALYFFFWGGVWPFCGLSTFKDLSAAIEKVTKKMWPSVTFWRSCSLPGVAGVHPYSYF